MDDALYSSIVVRSRGRCESEVWVSGWFRCDSPATDVHHLLPKSRGGRILDDYGETYHLMHLCRECHSIAHSRKEADGMMIDGSITWDKINNQPIYKGEDSYLKRKYRGISG